MSGNKPSLDSLKIDRSAGPKGQNVLLPVLVVLALLVATGAAAYIWWPASGIAVKAVTAEGGGGAAGSGLDASGYVVARRQATLSAKIMGKVAEVNLEEGQHVEKDQIVARLDDANQRAALNQAMAQQRLAKSAFDDIAPIYGRYSRLHEQGAVSMDAFDNQRAAYNAARNALGVADAVVAMARANENDTYVRAPYSGVVTQKAAQVGEIVSPSSAGGGFTRTGIATIVDMDSLEVEVDVSENYIERVHPGGEASITLDAYPEWQIPASVIAIIPTADQSKGTVKVRIAINAKDTRILPQMGAHVSFLSAKEEGGAVRRNVTVPADSVAGNGSTATVFVINGDKVEARQVKTGLRTAQSVTILSGIQAGDRLASGNLAALHDGAKVKIQD